MPTIREARVSKGLTQFQLADIMKVTINQVSAWERGINQPKLANVKKLCFILDLSIDNLDFPMSQEDVDILSRIKTNQSELVLHRVNAMIAQSTFAEDDSHKDLEIVSTNDDKPTTRRRRMDFTNPSYEDTWNVRFVDPYRIDHEAS